MPQLPSNAAAKAKQGERNAAEAKLRPPIEAPKESPPSPMQSAPEVISQQPQLADRAVEQFAAGGGQSIVEENTLWGRSPRFDDYSQPVQGSPRHPLDGVPHFQDLPDPEELVEDARETAEQGGVVSLFGDYLARCLFSKVWALREAALSKMRLLFPELIAQGEEIEAALPILATVIRVSVEDKMHQVLLGGVTLLREVLEIAERCGFAPLLLYFATLRLLARRAVVLTRHRRLLFLPPHIFRPRLSWVGQQREDAPLPRFIDDGSSY